MFTFPVRLVKKDKVAKNFYEYTLQTLDNKDFIFKPGQYIWVSLPHLAIADPRGDRRAFSVTGSYEKKGEVSFLFYPSESGYKKTLQSLPVGTAVQITGPFGSSYTTEESVTEPIVMIAGGIGIAPFLSILRSLKSGSSVISPLKLIYLTSHPDASFVDNLSTLTQDGQVPFIHHTGKFSEELLPSDINFSKNLFYICGSQTLVDVVYSILRKRKVSFEQMHFEEFYPTAPYSLTEEDFKEKTNQNNVMLNAIEKSKGHVIITDANGVVIFANRAAQNNTGFTFEEMRTSTPRLWGGLMPNEFYQHLWSNRNEISGFDGEIANRRKNGETYHVIVHISPILDNQKHVTGYISTEEDITKKNQLDRAKTEFISLAAHELRSNPGIIDWSCELLLNDKKLKLNPEQKGLLLQIDRVNKRTLKLVESLLNTTRFELSTFSVNPEILSIPEVLESLLSDSKQKFESKHLRVVKDIDPNTPLLSSDRNLLEVVFDNLLRNAIKYSKEKGVIRVCVKPKKDDILITLADTGIGIPEDEKGKIFTKLFRAQNVQSVEGTGLGLYLAKAIVEFMNGTISFTSKENLGTTFYVTLPYSGLKKKKGTTQLLKLI